MLDQSLIKSNFIGKDGFLWWIGQIPPEENHREQINGGGWSHRYKVRILGLDSQRDEILPGDKLRWAQVMLPTTAGSGGANYSMSVAISPGDTVFGFFLDGDDRNVPVILGVFPRTSFVSTDSYRAAFEPYTGYTRKVINDGGYILRNESNENNTRSQKSPRMVSLQQARRIGVNERSAFVGIGDVIKAASGSASSTTQKLSAEIDNFVNRIQSITDNVSGAVGNVKDLITAEIGKVTEKIQKISSGIINDLMNNTYRSLASTLNLGLKILYKTTYALVFAATGSDRIAHIAGVAAQKAFVPGVKAIQDALPCITNTILNKIGETIYGLLESVAENVSNFVSCVSNQFIGGLLNHIISISDKMLMPLVLAVNPIRLGFEVVDFLRSSAESLLSPRNNISCDEIKPSYVSAPVNKWVIGRGPNDQPGVPISSIIETANNAASIAQSFLDGAGDVAGEISNLSSIAGSLDILKKDFSSSGFEGKVSDCFGGFPSNCGGTKVKIFGGRGKGAVAKAIMGSIVGEGTSATGSVIGFDILSGGSGYDFPPFIEIVDDCKKGRGAIARAVVKDGKLVDIYVVSEGENYPANPSEEIPEDIDQETYQNSTGPYVIDDIVVIEPGTGYTNDDVVFDANNPDIEYKVQVLPTIPTQPQIEIDQIPTQPQIGEDGQVIEDGRGQILKVLPINSETTNVVEVKNLPELRVRTKRGYGAILKAKLKPRRIYQGEIKRQIDCIT